MTYLPDFHVVIYKKCQYTVLPSQIESYFIPKKPIGSKKPAKKPHSLSKVRCERVRQDIAKIDGLIPNPEVLKQCEFLFLLATARPIPELGLPQTNGLRYTFTVGRGECRYICCSLQ